MAGLSLDALDELSALLRHRWDLVILDGLSRGPLRYRDLVQRTLDRSGQRISEGVLSLTLSRLIEDDLVTKQTTGRRSVYRLTAHGHERVAHLERICEVATSSRVHESPSASRASSLANDSDV